MTPVEIARQALHRLAELGLAPTPENYEAQYRSIAGLPPREKEQQVQHAGADQGLLEMLRALLGVISQANDGLRIPASATHTPHAQDVRWRRGHGASAAMRRHRPRRRATSWKARADRRRATSGDARYGYALPTPRAVARAARAQDARRSGGPISTFAINVSSHAGARTGQRAEVHCQDRHPRVGGEEFVLVLALLPAAESLTASCARSTCTERAGRGTVVAPSPDAESPAGSGRPGVYAARRRGRGCRRAPGLISQADRSAGRRSRVPSHQQQRSRPLAHFSAAGLSKQVLRRVAGVALGFALGDQVQSKPC
jgi:hypothetical protein